jgi:plastocyanin
MNKRFGAIAILVAAGAATAGLFASASNSAPTLSSATASSGACYKGPLCLVSITATGPSPSRVKMIAGDNLYFDNTDSVTHTVVFANGRCNLTISPKSEGGSCNPNFLHFVGSYAYTVDGKFAGTVATIPWGRSVTLTARRHEIRRGTRLILHGRVSWYNRNPAISWKSQLLVKVLARHDSGHHFEPIATVRFRARFPQGHGEDQFGLVSYGWKLKVRPGVTTTYIAKVTGGAPPHWQGQFWINAKSRPFTVRIRH